jgi:predicted PurR-regulated permease PerM
MAADYIVRPVLIKDSTELPFLAVLFGFLGGVVSMGIVGLIIGPVILALLHVLLREATVDPSATQGSD